MTVDFSFFEESPLIHIGYPKNLSKWMQKNLFVPNNGFIKTLNPLLSQILISSKRPFQFEELLIQEKVNFSIARAQKIATEIPASKYVPIITSEALVGNLFCGGYDAEILAGRLKNIAPTANILIVVREQSSMLRSLYGTAVGWGCPHGLKDFLSPRNENIAPQFNLSYLKYDQLVAHYQKLFSKDSVTVVPYELFLKSQQDFANRIFSINSKANKLFPRTDLPFGTIENVGQTIVEIKLQRLFNSIFVQGPFNYAGLFRDRPSWHDFRNNWRAPINRQGFIVTRLEQRQRQLIEELTEGVYAESNNRLSQLTGIDFSAFGYKT